MTKKLLPHQIQPGGCYIVDVREFPEFAAGAIHGAQLVPLATVEQAAAQWDKQKEIVLVCRSGKRAGMAAEKLERLGFQNIAVLTGGMEGWLQVGLPVQTSDRKIWSMERQVRAMAGTMVAVFTVLGLTVSQWFFALTLFVGAGLTFAAVTDLCLMATILGKLPWNRAGQSASPLVPTAH